MVGHLSPTLGPPKIDKQRRVADCTRLCMGPVQDVQREMVICPGLYGTHIGSLG